PRAAVVAPPSAFLHEQEGGAVAVRVDGEQAGGAVDAPVLVAVRAHGPAVPILRRHTSHLVATGAAPPDGGVFREGFERARRTARTAATVVHEGRQRLPAHTRPVLLSREERCQRAGHHCGESAPAATAPRPVKAAGRFAASAFRTRPGCVLHAPLTSRAITDPCSTLAEVSTRAAGTGGQSRLFRWRTRFAIARLFGRPVAWSDRPWRKISGIQYWSSSRKTTPLAERISSSSFDNSTVSGLNGIRLCSAGRLSRRFKRSPTRGLSALMASIFALLHCTSAFLIAAGTSRRSVQRWSGTDSAADSLRKVTMSRAWICPLKSESAARNHPSDRASRERGDPIFSPHKGSSRLLRAWSFAEATSSEDSPGRAPDR